MFIKSKNTTKIDLTSRLKEYIVKYYENESLKDSVKTYFTDLSNNRFISSQIGEVQDSIEQLKQKIKIITLYINKIMFINKNMTIGEESYGFKIEFIWNDTIKDSNWKSYNIWFLTL